MKIDFNEIDLSILPNFKGGELEYRAKMLTDDKHKIMKGLLIPGASIGLHKHENSSEIMFITKGKAKYNVIDDKGNKYVEYLTEGQCHYCKDGFSHELINETDSDLEFYAVVSNF